MFIDVLCLFAFPSLQSQYRNAYHLCSYHTLSLSSALCDWFLLLFSLFWCKNHETFCFTSSYSPFVQSHPRRKYEPQTASVNQFKLKHLKTPKTNCQTINLTRLIEEPHWRCVQLHLPLAEKLPPGKVMKSLHFICLYVYARLEINSWKCVSIQDVTKCKGHVPVSNHAE